MRGRMRCWFLNEGWKGVVEWGDGVMRWMSGR